MGWWLRSSDEDGKEDEVGSESFLLRQVELTREGDRKTGRFSPPSRGAKKG